MDKSILKFSKKGNIVFSVNINQKQNKSGEWKKEIVFPQGWQQSTKETAYINKKYNGLALLTGKVNNVIVVDIDNVDHWNKLLEEQKQKEPETVKVISGSGGIHLYFKYTKDLETLKSRSKVLKGYDIDVRTDGGCIIVPPSSYYNKKIEKEVEYKWVKSLLDMEPLEMPQWLKDALLKGVMTKLEKEVGDKIDEKTKKSIVNALDKKIGQTDEQLETTNNFSDDDIEHLVSLLCMKRCDNYDEWINVGMCLHNLNSDYYLIWKKWSKKSEKYEEGICKEKWKSFKKNKNGLKIGSLLMWCKEDNEVEYTKFMEKKKMMELVKGKYPNEKLDLGEHHKMSDNCKCIELKNQKCLIKGNDHPDLSNSMYIEIAADKMTLRCKHPECFGRSYCGHLQLTKQEMNIAFNGDITINMGNKEDELVEFQKINLFEDDELNELVYNGLNGKSTEFAEIIFYYYKNMYNYGEDNNWYIYEDHKWKNIGLKNNDLRVEIQKKLKAVYTSVLSYYKENDNEKNKIKTIKQLIVNFGETTLKNNIMTELIDLFLKYKNKKRDFVKKLDNNNNLIGFENGVYDLNKFEFREGISEDLITMTTGYEYNDKYTNKYKDLLKFLEDIQPNKGEMDYMLTYLSIGLFGNELELFTILTGNGRNGKSKLIELLKATFGEYFGSVQSQLFTRPRPDANSPDPGLLSLAKKRVVISSEPEKNSKLNSGFIKFITGRDSTTLRNCHSNDMIDFTAKFITLFVCNDIPECDEIDNAFSKRLRCINFPTEFVDKPTKENQKKIDVNINNNFEYWRNDFMLLLIGYYKKYKQTHILALTENILAWTNKYKEETDLYLQFLNECTENTKDDTDKIFCTDLYASFKEWFKINDPNSKIPSDKEFSKNLKKNNINIKESLRIENKVKRGIEGYKIKNNI
jgi:P4 family phage/plasmid primase-like protien